MLHLCKWIRDNTFCTYFDAFRAILPPGLSYTLQTRYEPVNGFSGELDMNERQLLERISQLRERYSPDAADRSLLKSLTEKGAVRESELLKRRSAMKLHSGLKSRSSPRVRNPRSSRRSRSR